MQLLGLARLGRDAELRNTQGGDAVANLSLAFNYGRKGADGKRPTQWVEASLWGKRAEALIDYLTKGAAVVVTLNDPHIEEYEGRNGPGHKLVATVSEIELVGSGERRDAAPAPARAPAAAPRPAARAANTPALDAMDDDSDVPF